MESNQVIAGQILHTGAKAIAISGGVVRIGHHLVCTILLLPGESVAELPPLRLQTAWIPRHLTLQHGTVARRSAPKITLGRVSLGGDTAVAAATYLGGTSPELPLATATIVDFWLNTGALSPLNPPKRPRRRPTA
ncbi:hypothetical protein [Amycolatopsis minnesotensis]